MERFKTCVNWLLSPITSDSAAWNSKNCGHAKLAKNYRMGCNCKAQSQWDESKKRDFFKMVK